MSTNPWYSYPICVPFGDPNYDSQYGGSHDMDVAAPANSPVTALLPGTVVDISAPIWGKQVGIHLDSPYHGIPYLAFMHLSAVSPSLHLGSQVVTGDLIGWVGGATDASQYAGTSNPTGQNFLNDPSQSSRIQVGIALMRGPVYGEGAGWTPQPDKSLDPTSLITEANTLNTAKVKQFNDVWFSQPYAYHSGIYWATLAAFLNGKISACYPTDQELKTVDWNMQSIQFQALSNGLHAEWNNSTAQCHVYDAFNRGVV